MRHTITPLLLAAALSIAPASGARAAGLSTTWTALVGDWSVSANWSAGEPTSAHAALIPSGVATVTQKGENCASVQLSGGGEPGGLQVSGGSLGVLGALTVGAPGAGNVGSVGQSAGLLTVETLDLVQGAVVVSNGSFSATTATVGSAASFTLHGAGEVVVAGSLDIAFGAGFTITGGTLVAGSDPADALVMAGVFHYGSTPDVVVQNLTFAGGSAALIVQLAPEGLTPMDVANTLTLDGIFQIVDSGAPEGRYDIAVAEAIAGDFDVVELPDGEWSWGIENTTLFVVKGQEMPVVEASWGRVKERFAPASR